MARQRRAWTGTRSALSTLLLVVGAILVIAGVVAGSVYDTISSSSRFAGTAVKAVQAVV